MRALDRLIRWFLPPLAIAAALVASIPQAGGRVERREAPRTVAPSARPELAIGLVKTPASLGPHGDWSVIEQFVTRLLWEPLVELDPTGVPRAVMAAEVPSFANGRVRLQEDGTGVVRWRLKPGLRWGDGTPVTTADIARDEPPFATFPGARSVEVEEGEIVVRYEGLRPGVILNCYPFPRARLAGLDAEARKRVMSLRLPPLSGPFVLRRFEPEKGEIELARNPEYAPRPALERVLVRIFESAAALQAAFRAGAVQLVPPGELDVNDAQALAGGLEGARALVVDAHYTYHLDVNLERPWLRDRRVRQALLHALDRETLVREAVAGNGRVAHTWLPPNHAAADPRIKRYEHDPRLARTLLEEAGRPEMPPLVLVRGDRHPKAIPDRLAADWAALGVKVEDRPLEYGWYMGHMHEVMQKGDWDLMLWGYDITPYETGREYWVEDMIPSEANGLRGYNYPRWREPRMRDIFARLDRTFNVDDMVDLLGRQQRIWADELPVLPLYTWKQATLVAPGLRGVRPHVVGGNLLGANAAEWRFSE